MLDVEELKSKIRLHFYEFNSKSNNRTLKLQRDRDNVVLFVTNYDLLFVEDVTNICCKELYIDYVDSELYTIEEIMEKLENFINEIKGN